MIAKLRRRHRRVAFALWLLIPAVWALSGLRAPEARMAALPEALRANAPAPDEVRWLGASEGIELGRVVRGPAAGRIAVRALAPLPHPDVLVYWLASEPAPAARVPDGALFRGRLDGTRPIAVAPPGPGGGLLLFSLGHQERVAWVDLGAVDASGATSAAGTTE